MKEIIKEHPLRQIVLQFDLGKPEAAFEQAALAQYYLSHDLTYQAQQNLQQHLDELLLLEGELADLSAEMYLPAQHLRELNDQLLAMSTDPDAAQGQLSLRLSIQQIEEELLIIRKKLDTIALPFIEEMRWHQRWCNDMYENESWLDIHAPNLLVEVYRRHTEVSVDIISLDRDEEAFNQTYGAVLTLHRHYQQYGNTIDNAFISVRDQLDNLFKQLEQVEKTVEQSGK